MSATDTFQSPTELAERLRSLQRVRKEMKRKAQRPHLPSSQRNKVLEKTDGHCHLCGGEISGPWAADHVAFHCLGGAASFGNFLPAHRLCNNYRFFYLPEEFQWILKLGVWLRTEIAKPKSRFGRTAAKHFCKYDRKRAMRSDKSRV